MSTTPARRNGNTDRPDRRSWASDDNARPHLDLKHNQHAGATGRGVVDVAVTGLSRHQRGPKHHTPAASGFIDSPGDADQSP